MAYACSVKGKSYCCWNKTFYPFHRWAKVRVTRYPEILCKKYAYNFKNGPNFEWQRSIQVRWTSKHKVSYDGIWPILSNLGTTWSRENRSWQYHMGSHFHERERGVSSACVWAFLWSQSVQALFRQSLSNSVVCCSTTDWLQTWIVDPWIRSIDRLSFTAWE